MVSVLFLVFGLFSQTIKIRELGRLPLYGFVKDADTARQVVKNELEAVGRAFYLYDREKSDDVFLDLGEQLGKVAFYERLIQPGQPIIFMLFKDKQGERRVLQNVEWAGEGPFLAFGFKIASQGKIYEFILPQRCGKICLLAVAAILEKPKEPEKPNPPVIKIPEPEPVIPKAPVTPVIVQPVPASNPKWQANVKVKLGYVFYGNELGWFGGEGFQELNEERDFENYLGSGFLRWCNGHEYGFFYTGRKDFPYRCGSSVELFNKRTIFVVSERQWPTIGAEVRLFKGLWVGVDFYTRKMTADIEESRSLMNFREVKYKGLYCDGPTHVYFMQLDRSLISNRYRFNVDVNEFDLSLRYYFSAGRVSLAPVLGVAYQDLVSNFKAEFKSELYYPFDETLKCSDDSTVNIMTKSRKFAFLAGAIAELKAMDNLRFGVEGWYGKFPEQSLMPKTSGIYHGDDASQAYWPKIKTDRCRLAVFLKIAI